MCKDYYGHNQPHRSPSSVSLQLPEELMQVHMHPWGQTGSAVSWALHADRLWHPHLCVVQFAGSNLNQTDHVRVIERSCPNSHLYKGIFLLNSIQGQLNIKCVKRSGVSRPSFFPLYQSPEIFSSFCSFLWGNKYNCSSSVEHCPAFCLASNLLVMGTTWKSSWKPPRERIIEFLSHPTAKVRPLENPKRA